jgi:hypothetical protein
MAMATGTGNAPEATRVPRGGAIILSLREHLPAVALPLFATFWATAGVAAMTMTPGRSQGRLPADN